jgi:ATP-binding protein involved in chromosome partitioning
MGGRIRTVSTVPISIFREERGALVTEEQVREALRGVNDPEIGRPIEDLGMLERIEVEDDLVRVYVLLTIAGCPLQERITTDVTAALTPIGVERVDVRMRLMSESRPPRRHA